MKIFLFRSWLAGSLALLSYGQADQPPTAPGQRNSGPSWKDRNGKMRAYDELVLILQNREDWLKAHGNHYSYDGIPGADDLKGADLHGQLIARMPIATFHDGKISVLTERTGPFNLSGIPLDEANLGGTNLSSVILRDASFRRANLSGANLSKSDLRGAILSGANLSNSDLRGADLNSADLSDADFSGTDLTGVIYEPKKPTTSIRIAYSKGLSNITWSKDPKPTFNLRKVLRTDGFLEAERKVTAAIRRHGQRWFERCFFDWTCEWGSNPFRPLELAMVSGLICAFIYWWGMHSERRAGLYLVASGQRIPTSKGKERVLKLCVKPVPPNKSPSQMDLECPQEAKKVTSTSSGPHRMVRRKVESFGTALMFSLMSTFNIGFREFNLGLWIRMIQAREFDIRARGWMRILSGVQSLMGVTFVALSVLSYFGRPFD